MSKSKPYIPAPPSQIALSATQFSGPIPPADEMRRYAEVFDELPQRIVQMAEAEQKHRFELDEAIRIQRLAELKVNSRLASYGILSSVICVILIMTAAVLCAWFGHPITGGVIGSGGVVMIVVTLVCGARIKSDSSSQKR